MSIWSQLANMAQKAFAEDADPPSGSPSDALAGLSCAPDPGDVGFTAAIIGLSAKLAKADGLVTHDEVKVFARVFRVPPAEEAAMLRVFNIARQTVHGYEAYARQIARKYRDRPCLLEGVLDGLFQIALADGVIAPQEMDYLQSVAEAFGFSEADFRRIRAAHTGPETNDPYAILGIPHDAAFETVRTAYRRLMRDNHPDTVASAKSAPREYEPVAHEKAAAITSAYARIRAERGFLTRAD